MARCASGRASAMSSCARTRSRAAPSGFRLGLALLERRGVAAWTRAWSSTAPASPLPAAAPRDGVPPVPVDDELVGALASMALARVAGG